MTKLLVFLGPVGVGKSTVIRGILALLESKGIKCYKEFFKVFHGIAYLLWILIAKLINLPNAYAPWFMMPYTRGIRLARYLIILSAYMDSFLNLPLKLLKIKILKSLNYIVISEEYLYSTIFDYIYSYVSYGIKGNIFKIPIKFLWILAKKYTPDKIIILEAPINELLVRWRSRGYGEPSLKYIKTQIYFLKIINDKSAIRINTYELNAQETIKTILDRLALIDNGNITRRQ